MTQRKTASRTATKKTAKVAARQPKPDGQEQDEREAKPQAPRQESNFARSEAGIQAERERAELHQQQRRLLVEDLGDAAAVTAKSGAPDVAERHARRQRALAEKTPQQFVLLAGDHEDEDGNKYTYSRGQETIVESRRDLDKDFSNKFRRVEGRTSPGRDFVDAVDRVGLMDPLLAVRRPHGQASQFSRDTDEKAQRRLAASRGEVYPDDEEEAGDEEEATTVPASQTEEDEDDEK